MNGDPYTRTSMESRTESDTFEGQGEGDLAMRVLEAQEAQRRRLAQEIHDGPA